MRRGSFVSGPGRTALGGLLTAMSALCLYLACFIPTNRLALAAIAGLFPVAAVLVSGRRAGCLCWMASGILGLLLVPEKWLALLYLSFFGHYPIVKSTMEAMKSRIAEWMCKLLYFNTVLLVFGFGLSAVFLPALPAFLARSAGVSCVLLNIVFLVYDIGLSRLIVYLERRFPWKRGSHQ